MTSTRRAASAATKGVRSTYSAILPLLAFATNMAHLYQAWASDVSSWWKLAVVAAKSLIADESKADEGSTRKQKSNKLPCCV
jgi:hypothetical protein